MKKIIASVLLIGCATFGFSQTISFEKTAIDYGKVAYGGDGQKVFTFKNTGDKPLIISKAAAGCGCTTPEWDTNPVLPGKTGEIKVGYNTKITGVFKKEISVYSNDPVNGRVVLYINGEVEANPNAEMKTAQDAKPPVEDLQTVQAKRGVALQKDTMVKKDVSTEKRASAKREEVKK